MPTKAATARSPSRCPDPGSHWPSRPPPSRWPSWRPGADAEGAALSPPADRWGVAVRNGVPDAVLGDLYPFQDRYVRLSDGTTLHYVEWGGGFRRPTVLLLH